MSLYTAETKGGKAYVSSMESKESLKTLLTPENLKDGKWKKVEEYKPSDEEKAARSMVVQHFGLGYMTMYTPRVEFNDLSVIQRMQVDQMAFNTYQTNNGMPPIGDELNAWRSRAIRPVVRNKCISIAAHATARLVFPKVRAYDENNDEQRDAARVMESLMEWAADQSDYSTYNLYRTITALTDPASIGYTEYCETYRIVKRPDGKGGYTEEKILDETLSGFQDKVVPVDELFIENFYEQDIQKQGWLIWRKVISYSLAEAKYKQKYPNFAKWVRPGVQLLYNDANQSFYQVYDTNMRPYDVEEVIYWNRSLDVMLILVNGVLLTTPDNPNPRNDKLYPFDKYGYEVINNRCFYYKSLAFKVSHDADIINTLYPMMIDGTYLSIMQPMVAKGSDIIGSDVIIPGTVTTFNDPDSELKTLGLNPNLSAGFDMMAKVDESINSSSESPLQAGQQQPGDATAYEISRQEQNAATVLGLFVKMMSQHVKDYGKLRMGDIIQYMTLPEVEKITGDAPLVYKTFVLHDKKGSDNTKKIVFDAMLPDDPVSPEEALNMSFDVYATEEEQDITLMKVNPTLFRNMKYMASITPDIMNPMSEDLIRAYNLELFDRMIKSPQMFDQEEAARLLLETNPLTKKSPDKYIAQEPQPQLGGGMNVGGQTSPLAEMGKSLPQTMGVGGLQ